ncbi:MAG: hypothetical protein QG637_1016, partial [Chloroflexota bacterium]|nr:hypothetical protein [Chloroflexota bacterium]
MMLAHLCQRVNLQYCAMSVWGLARASGTMAFMPELYDAYIFDLDGTVYLGDALLPTAGETITRLRGLGRRTVFLSNNPSHTREDYARKLTRLGLPTPPGDVINS